MTDYISLHYMLLGEVHCTVQRGRTLHTYLNINPERLKAFKRMCQPGEWKQDVSADADGVVISYERS